MRRKDREITDFNRIVEIVDKCDIVRLGLAAGDYPYVVPVNFAYTAEGGQLCIYIHGAMAGRKFEMLKNNPCGTFLIDNPIKMECLYEDHDVTMRYESVMGKFTAELLDGEARQKAIDDVIMARYEETKNFEYNKPTVARTAVFKLTVTEMVGKSNAKGEPDV